ncbi:hypothetical protein GH714_041665 [Hevea brasiliensis]|uniref:Aluminum-activated malate transporter n=1 Tax=Hevea brasiliensis TaxID=3981 RepID=A0A6A6MSY8_HEVBR|nr:hypothetical protein GH714_041665 [Hevea brasiliensis]
MKIMAMGKEKWEKHIHVLAEKIKTFPGFVWQTTWRQTTWRVGRDDPRRVIHAFKVGLALTLVSLLYLLEPLFEGIGQSAIWAVMTVVVVLEFTAGATLCKGLNRGLGTLLAGSLAFAIEFIAQETGHVFRAIFIGAAVFVIGAAATYIRFFPKVKKNYDYGVVIFLLTFNLITVSSFALAIDEEKEAIQDKSSEDPIYKGYKNVLDSKSQDETLATHASWEPRHSRHCRYPWQQYVKLGGVLCHFSYTVVALHGCLLTEIQTPRSCRALFKDPCIRVASEVSKALMELANSIRNHRHCSPEILSDHLHEALQDLTLP